VTALSGDLDGNDTTDPHGVVTTTENIAGTNAWTVVTGSGVTETAGLDGFTITAGNANSTDADCAWNEPCRSGGGMYNDQSSPSLVNVTFSGNAAPSGYGGGMYNYDNSSPTLVNGILWGNTDSGSDEENAQIHNQSSVVTVTYSLVAGGVYTGTGNISADPLFIRHPEPGGDGSWGTPDDDYGDLRLRPGSPAIDVGNNAAVPAGVTTNLAGWARIINGTVDMGAYETPLTVHLPLVLRTVP
jgi:hypothetical protein